jgi:hypothetical protein
VLAGSSPVTAYLPIYVLATYPLLDKSPTCMTCTPSIHESTPGHSSSTSAHPLPSGARPLLSPRSTTLTVAACHALMRATFHAPTHRQEHATCRLPSVCPPIPMHQARKGRSTHPTHPSGPRPAPPTGDPHTAACHTPHTPAAALPHSFLIISIDRHAYHPSTAGVSVRHQLH